jgi:L-alanine-DL-glutamate epimerase-like enolase superfamily enzyme
MKLDVRRRTLRMARPFETSYGELREREILIVTLTDADGVRGRGEAVPLEAYDGVGIARALAAIERYREPIESLGAPTSRRAGLGPGAGEEGDSPQTAAGAVMEACRAADPLPQALAAIDMALWDRAGVREGKSLARMLVDDPSPTVAVNATLAAADRAGAAFEAAEAVARGFGCLKLKVGLGDDAGRVAAARAAAGPEVALRLDANGAWTVEQAVSSIEALAPAGLELVEEPVRGIAAIRAVRERVPVRIAIDETAAEPGALGAGVADAVCLKLSRCGGVSGLLAAASFVRATGAEAYVASTLDGPLGIAAGVHVAAALAARGPLAACGLATLSLFAGVEDELPVREGLIQTPSGPGLGLSSGP